jgi:DNA ligase-1
MASAQERPILFRLLHNELRIGLHDGLIQEAIARASGSELKKVRRAALFLSDLAEVAVIALTAGAEGLTQVDIKLFVPLLPMLSELSQDFDEILKTHNGKTSLEYKYDGARVQIHKDREQIRIWSRRLTEVTASLPDIAEIARQPITGRVLYPRCRGGGDRQGRPPVSVSGTHAPLPACARHRNRSG